MSTIQVRNVPDDLRSTLKVRAAAAGQSLSEYLLAELIRIARQPTLAELSVRIDMRGAVAPEVSAAQVLADERSER